MSLFLNISYAQIDSIQYKPIKLSLNGFVDMFYAYDFNKPQTDYRQPFFYNYNRKNLFNLNLGYIKFSAEHRKFRANLALHAGTYSRDNYAAEPSVLKNIFEANAGLSLNKKNNLWLDVGVFASHIGFESAVATDNWTLTRSILAENSPYYLTGAKLTYNPNDKMEAAIIICNGWQHIQPVKGNTLPSFGTQIKYKPTDKIILNWSTFIGTNDPDVSRRMRYFSNLYVQFQLSEKWGLIAGFDIGAEQRFKRSENYNYWLSPVLIARYALNNKIAIAARAEYYHDENGVMITSPSTKGFKVFGLSSNFDYYPTPKVLCRLEGRWLNSPEKIFQQENKLSNNNFCLITSIAIKFSK